MRGWRALLWAILVASAAGCNLDLPQVTPTLAPSRTPTATQPATFIATFTASPLPITPSSTPTRTPSITPSATLTPSATATVTASMTLSRTPAPTATLTHTPRPTVTPTASSTPTVPLTATPVPSSTATATLTATPVPSSTATATPRPTETALPTLTATSSPTPLASATPLPTATWTLPPSFTPLPTLTNTPLAALLPSPTVLASATPLPPSPTAPPPTLAVTPLFITLDAPATTSASATPLASATPTPFGPTPFPTVALVITLPPLVTPIPALLLPPRPETRAFALSTAGGVTSTGFALLRDTVLFARNPVDPNLYVTTDSSGNLYLTGLDGANAYRPDMSPFSQFFAPSRAENPAYVNAVAWSPDGRYLAFSVAGRKIANDGVWYFQPGAFPPVQLLADCPAVGFIGCQIVSNPTNPDTWETQGLAWSPTSDALLVSLNIPNEGRSGLVVLPAQPNERARDVRPPVLRYGYGSWSRDGSQLLVSGSAPDGQVYVAWVGRDGAFSQMVYAAEANGLWLGFANQARDGRVLALGAPGGRSGPTGPLRLYAMNGQALTTPLGDSFPTRVIWSPDGSAVFVQTNSQQLVAQSNGTVRAIDGQVAGAQAVNWVDGALPAGDGFVGVTGLGGLLEDANQTYQIGQQLRVQQNLLNVRSGPSTVFPPVRSPLLAGEYVVIISTSIDNEGYIWWQIQTADGFIGWLAGSIEGQLTLAMP